MELLEQLNNGESHHRDAMHVCGLYIMIWFFYFNDTYGSVAIRSVAIHLQGDAYEQNCNMTQVGPLGSLGPQFTNTHMEYPCILG